MSRTDGSRTTSGRFRGPGVGYAATVNTPPAHATAPDAHVVLRPFGTPLPLGFLGQAVASLSFSALQLGWIGTGQSHTVAWSILVLTVPLQLLAGVLGFLGRDPVAGTGTALLAGGWGATAVVTLSTPVGSTSAGLGMVLLGLGAALLVPVTVGWTKAAAALVMLLSSARFAATGIYELGVAPAWESTAGWLGLALCAVSFYSALAFEMESTSNRTVLPVGRSGSARLAERGDLADQQRSLANEAGVTEVL